MAMMDGAPEPAADESSTGSSDSDGVGSREGEFSGTNNQEDGVDEADFLTRYKTYMQHQLADGERLQPLMRHLLHSFNGRPGARRFRRTLSDHERLKRGDASILDDALSHIFGAAA